MNDRPFLEQTACLLRGRASEIRLKTIANECKVSVAWLSKLQTGKLDNAPVKKLQCVFDWLKAKKNA